MWRETLTPEARELVDALDLKAAAVASTLAACHEEHDSRGSGGGNSEVPPQRRLLVAQTAPAVRVAFAEEFGLPSGALSPGQLVAALKVGGYYQD